MLVQSHENQIILLPALPKDWSKGNVKGLHLRGNHILNMTWENGRIIEAIIIHAKNNKPMPIYLNDQSDYKITESEGQTTIKLKTNQPIDI